MGGWDGLGLMIVVGVGFGVVSIILGRLLGPRHPTPEKMAPYECGMPPVGDARERQSVKFYLIAMIFLLFDIEIAFLGPWAMAIRQLAWPGFIQIVVFFLILMVGYVYVWRKGVLDWGPEHDPDYARAQLPPPGPAEVKRYSWSVSTNPQAPNQ